jgi:hypothetical protein
MSQVSNVTCHGQQIALLFSDPCTALSNAHPNLANYDFTSMQ